MVIGFERGEETQVQILISQEPPGAYLGLDILSLPSLLGQGGPCQPSSAFWEECCDKSMISYIVLLYKGISWRGKEDS